MAQVTLVTAYSTNCLLFYSSTYQCTVPGLRLRIAAALQSSGPPLLSSLQHLWHQLCLQISLKVVLLEMKPTDQTIVLGNEVWSASCCYPQLQLVKLAREAVKAECSSVLAQGAAVATAARHTTARHGTLLYPCVRSCDDGEVVKRAAGSDERLKPVAVQSASLSLTSARSENAAQLI